MSEYSAKYKMTTAVEWAIEEL